MADTRKIVRTALESRKVVFGANESIKALKGGKAAQVVVSKNCPTDVRDRIKSASPEAVVMEFDGNAVELGIFCGKPFSIAVLAITE